MPEPRLAGAIAPKGSMRCRSIVPSWRSLGARSSPALARNQLQRAYWLLLTAFVRGTLLQASVTSVCPVVILLRRRGLRP